MYYTRVPKSIHIIYLIDIESPDKTQYTIHNMSDWLESGNRLRCSFHGYLSRDIVWILHGVSGTWGGMDLTLTISQNPKSGIWVDKHRLAFKSNQSSFQKRKKKQKNMKEAKRNNGIRNIERVGRDAVGSYSTYVCSVRLYSRNHVERFIWPDRTYVINIHSVWVAEIQHGVFPLPQNIFPWWVVWLD